MAAGLLVSSLSSRRPSQPTSPFRCAAPSFGVCGYPVEWIGEALDVACNGIGGLGQVVGMSSARHLIGPPECLVTGSVETGSVDEFEVFYRATVGDVAAFFARRYREPQLVADLTSEVFLEALASLDSFDSARGAARAWLFGIVRRVWAQHCERTARGREAITALAAYRQLGDDEIEEIAARIDAPESTPKPPRASCSPVGRGFRSRSARPSSWSI